MIDWNKIKELTNQHGYMSGVDRESDRVKKTGEVYTPTDLVLEIIQQMDINSFAPGKDCIGSSVWRWTVLSTSKNGLKYYILE